MKKINIFSLLGISIIMTSCSSNNGDYYKNAMLENGYIENEEYSEINERGFIDPSVNPLSNFSLDSSSYAYSNIRRLIKDNQIVSKDAVNIEQMLNYFDYSYTNNTTDALSTTIELGNCPWNEDHHLAAISVNAKELEIENKDNNFVFLIDASGSMNTENKMGLLKESFRLFANSLDERDTVSIVTYANGVKEVAKGIKGNEKIRLIEAVEEISASGGTNGSRGIQKAYDLANKYFINGGNNRILLATDGDFNIGIKNENELNDFISSKRESGVYLSIFGYGLGNTKHNKMETLAKNGNGNAYYIDSVLEAKKVFVSELGSVLNTVAKDSKIQLEFNPNNVVKYRLLGYENSMLTDDEFLDENQDAGEIGAGHTTLALYELELKDTLKNEYIFKTDLRYKDVNQNENSKQIKDEISLISDISEDFIFASCVAEFGLILRDSYFKGVATFNHLINRLEQLDLSDDPYKEDFKNLVKLAMKNYEINY